MKVTAAPLASLLVFVASVAADTVSFDNAYDNGLAGMGTVACSDGPNGLANRFPAFMNVPSFPNIGGAQAVAGYGSPNCGTCWRLTFQGRSINVTVIDHAGAGFNIAQAAMDTLTNGQAASLGRVTASAIQIPPSGCGL